MITLIIGCRVASPTLVSNNPVFVRLNTGNGFADEAIEWPGIEAINKGNNIGNSANAAFTFPLWFLKVNPSGNLSSGISKEKMQIRDIDGDGFPDYLSTDANNDSDNLFNIKRSTINRTNLLEKVTRPLKGSFTLDYQRIGNTYEMPNNVWALSYVQVNDGYNIEGDGQDVMRTAFEYENGYYQRCEREFYGFENVRQTVQNLFPFSTYYF